MTKPPVANLAAPLVAAYDPGSPEVCADGLREQWLLFDPSSIAVIAVEQRERQETVGIPVSVLRALGKEIGKTARKRVSDFIPLVRLLWDSYGREGRVVALVALGGMELAAPDAIVPMLKEMCRTCITWEDADRLAMDALEPIVRKDPDQWLATVEHWLTDESKWVRRSGITVIGRLPMKLPAYTARCVRQAERLLLDEEIDVRRAVSFAIRLAARGDVVPVRDFLGRHVPPPDAAATWVLCDVIRSMARKLLPEFGSLLPLYERWSADPALTSRDRRSVESAVTTLQRAQS